MAGNKKPRKKYRQGVRLSPVGAVYARKSLQDTALELKINMYMTDDGELAVDLLADLAIVLGTTAESGRMVHGPVPWVKQLHSGLRNIQAICVDNGYRWSKAQAPYLDGLLDKATKELFNAPLDALLVANDAAHWFARVIRAQKVSRETIVGPEVWNKGTPV